MEEFLNPRMLACLVWVLAHLSFKIELSLRSYLPFVFMLLCLALGHFVSNEISPTYT